MMARTDKHPNTLRHGGPGASEENAKRPPPADQAHRPAPDSRSNVSGGGGEQDSHHTQDAELKGGARKEFGRDSKP
jgi:hypothetical protein